MNLGPSAPLIDGLDTRFRVLRERHGRALSLIGWSLGGIYARELARRHPADVRQVITLASPFRDPYATTAARLLGHLAGPRDVERRRRMSTPPPVPCTSFYSRTDGVVAWQSCVDEASPWTENVEVQSSHCGMGHHPGVLLAIAERLARPAR